jgi:PAS domain S-box-containing protein
MADPDTPVDAAAPRHRTGKVRKASAPPHPDPAEGIALENLITELSARFSDLPPVEIDRAIEDALRRVCECLGQELSLVWQWNTGRPGILALTHHYLPAGIPLPSSEYNAWDYFPWTLQRVMSGQAVPIASLGEMPPEAARDREAWGQLNLKSTVILPLSALGHPLIGIMSIDSTRKERRWPEALVSRLMVFARTISDALARKAAMTALEEREARLASAVDLAGLAFFEITGEGRATFLDGRSRLLFGIPLGEEHRTHEYWVARMHPEDRDALVGLGRQLRSGILDQATSQYRYLHPERGMLWLHHLSRAVERDAAGRATRLIGVVRDITERKLAEEALSDMAEQFATITSMTTDAFWEVDAEGRFLLVNDEACRMSGFSRDEMLAMSVTDLEAAQSPAEIRQELAHIRACGRSRFETRHRCKDGRVLDVEVSAAYRQSSGTSLVFIRDVTARKRGQQQLQESLEFNSTILASLVDHVAILDRDGAILAINDAWVRFALENGGAEPLARSGVGTNYLDVCRRAEALEVLERIESVLDGRSNHYRSEYPCPSPTESRWFLMEVMPLRRASGGAVVVHRDVSARKKTEAELERLRMDIWHAHRVAQTGAISASLAHELNQPLAAILSNAQAGVRLMSREDPDLDEIRAILTDIVQDDKRAAAVIHGLRAMLRRKETRRETLDLTKTTREVLALAHSELIAHDIDVVLRPESDFLLSADKAQIQQVILNLVMNAIEAMEGLPPERRRLEVSLTPNTAGEVLLAVRDWGPGIPESEQQSVFDAFRSTKPQGMGIGLMICRSIIESHGGNLWFANNEDQGVTFFVTLPLSTRRDSTRRRRCERST